MQFGFRSTSLVCLIGLVACSAPDGGGFDDAGAVAADAATRDAATREAPSRTDAGRAADAAAPPEAGPPDAAEAGAPSAQSLLWVWYDFASSLATVAANPKSFTHISPALYQLNYAYTSGVAQWWDRTTDDFDGLTSTQIAQKIHAAGMKCVPLIFAGAGNAGTDQGIHDILSDSPAGTQAAFIDSMVQEAVAKGYDGYNLDWEVSNSQTPYATYGAELDSFLAAFRTALHAHGMQLSFDLGTWYLKQSMCSGGTGFVDLKTIGKNVDLAIVEAYSSHLGTASSSCPASLQDPLPCADDFMSVLDLMCVYVPNAAISMGFNANPSTGSNPVAGAIVAATKAYGIRNVAVWPDYNGDGPGGTYVLLDARNIQPQGATWFQLLADFLAAP
jgi:hypothetical protein